MKKLLLTVLCLGLLLTAGCSKDNEPSSDTSSDIADYPVKVGDVTVLELPDKVVSLSPSITEIIFALGADTKLCGVSDYCDYPEKTEGLPKLGTAVSPKLSELTALSPDVVFTSQPLSDADSAQLALQNIPVIVLGAPTDFDGLSLLYHHTALVLGGNKSGPLNGQVTFDRVKAKIDAITAEQGEPNIKCCYLSALSSDGKNAYVATGDTLAGKLVEASGGVNVAADATGYSMTVADLAAAKPEYIFCDPDAFSAVKNNAALKNIPAVKNGKLMKLDSALMERHGERLVDAVSLMAGALGGAPAGSAGSFASSGSNASQSSSR